MADLEIDRPADHVLRFTLNRPAKWNALNVAMREGMLEALRAIVDDPSDTRAVILTGAGDVFCSGGDVLEFDGFLKPRPVDGYRAQMRFQDMSQLLLQLPCPVIAAINGPAAGGGTCIALMSDLRIASDRATFQVGQVVRGLVPDVGLTWILPRLVGTANALEMMFLNEEVTAEEAKTMGFVNRVVAHEQVGEAALEMARKLAASSRTSLEWIKRTTYTNLDLPLEAGFRVEAMSQALMSATDDFEEALAAFEEKRPPRFE